MKEIRYRIDKRTKGRYTGYYVEKKKDEGKWEHVELFDYWRSAYYYLKAIYEERADWLKYYYKKEG